MKKVMIENKLLTVSYNSMNEKYSEHLITLRKMKIKTCSCHFRLKNYCIQ